MNNTHHEPRPGFSYIMLKVGCYLLAMLIATYLLAAFWPRIKAFFL